MKAYVYKAELLCEECGNEVIAELAKGFRETAEAEVAIQVEQLEKALGIELFDDSPKLIDRLVTKRAKAITPDIEDESSYDSDEYPKGPYGDGGGEADTPRHCDHCKEFLENPLTTDGMNYVRENQRDEWDSFYDIERDEVTSES